MQTASRSWKRQKKTVSPLELPGECSPTDIFILFYFFGKQGKKKLVLIFLLRNYSCGVTLHITDNVKNR